ncbi:MAG: DUF4349 domain-containing protein [Propionibacteriaceae bacterium]|jgi:hypothetical protein|nr:DUF4349 domain-containing protein [Propionibacteriaceae bacterium]
MNDQRRGIGAVVLGLAVGLALLGGCSGGAHNTAGGDPADNVPEAPAPASAPQPSDLSGDVTQGERQIARTAGVSLVVDDVMAAAQSLHDVATGLGGWVGTEVVSLPDNGDVSTGSGSVQLVVPADQLEAALDQVAAVGQVTDRKTNAEDVTEQVVDTASRIKTMRASIDRLQQLMAQSGSVAEIAAVESDLTQRQAELESLLAVQKSLDHRIATATIEVSLRTPTVVERDQASGFTKMLRESGQVMAQAARVLVIVIAALLPWLALAAVIFVPLLLVRRRHRRGRSATRAVPDPTPEPAPADPVVPAEAGTPPADPA